MQKKIIICLVLLIVVINVVILTNPIKENEDIIDNSLISMNLQDEEGNYFETKNINFNEEGYHFNKRKSNCEGGSELSWDDGKLQITTDKTDKCHVYLDNNKFVEDLSGNGHHGKGTNIAGWDENGITTSDETKNGFVNCGLENYDFGNTISLILKLKVNINVNYHGMPLRNNHDGTGVGFSIVHENNTFAGEITTDSPRTNSWLGASIKYDLNEWYTLVETYDGQFQKIYINGVLATSKNLIGNIMVSNRPFLIGANPFNSNLSQISAYTYATISNVLIFDRALTEEEIAKDYTNEINPTNKQNLLLWYKFD